MAIKTSGLRMVYNPGLFLPRKVGLENLDLEVPAGSIFGYLGRNGAGKTSTIKILVGLQFATAGAAWIRGEDVRASRTRRHIGFMPEEPYFYEYLTAEETLDFYGKLSGLDRATRQQRTAALLAQFGLHDARKAQLRTFSKGMRQRMGLAQAVLHKPAVAILDEPMSGLDPLGRREIRNLILALRAEGCTVFFSSHILSDVEEICDRVCVIDHGRRVAEGPLSSLLTGKVIEVKLSAANLPREGAPGLAPLAVRAWHDGALYHVLVDSEEKAQRVKELLEKAGGILRGMEPHKESLEEYFLRVTSTEASPVLSPTPSGEKAAQP